MNALRHDTPGTPARLERPTPATAALVAAMPALAPDDPLGPLGTLALAAGIVAGVAILGRMAWRYLAGPRYPAVISLLNARDAAIDAAPAADRASLDDYMAELESLLVARLPEDINEASLHIAEATCARDILAGRAASDPDAAARLLGALQRSGFAVPAHLEFLQTGPRASMSLAMS